MLEIDLQADLYEYYEKWFNEEDGYNEYEETVVTTVTTTTTTIITEQDYMITPITRV